MKNGVQKFGKFLSAMVMPNIGAFIAWGLDRLQAGLLRCLINTWKTVCRLALKC